MASGLILPRRKTGKRPTCEAVMPAMYYHRQYRTRDQMIHEFKWFFDVFPVGHYDACYCLDRPEPATGGHREGDFVYDPLSTTSEEEPCKS